MIDPLHLQVDLSFDCFNEKKTTVILLQTNFLFWESKSYIVSALTSFTAARISLIGTSKPVSIEFEYEISAIIRIICKRSLQVVLHLNMTNMCRQRQKTLTHAQQSTYLLCMHTSLSRSYQI